MRVTQGGVSFWYGTSDAPAPSGVVHGDGHVSVAIGLHPADAAASVTVLYRINHGAPLTAIAHPTHHDGSGRQYFQATLSGFKSGDKVEYVAIYRSRSIQIPSNHEAESHVVTFTVAPAAHAPIHAAASQHQGPDANDPKEALRAIMHAASVPGSKALEESFIKLYFAHDAHAESFWAELQKHPDLKPHVAQLQFLLQVDLLASGHVPLIAALMKMPGVKSMRDLALLDESVWHGFAAKSGAPPHIVGATSPAREQFLVASIQATLQAAFPTLTVWRIASHDHHVDPLAAKFLENSPDFDICTTRVDIYVEQHAATAWKGIPDAKRTAVLKDVKRLQRLFAVSVNADSFRALLGTGLGSAHEVAVIPEGTFEVRYAATLGGAAAALQIHQRAQFINARALHLRTSINDAYTRQRHARSDTSRKRRAQAARRKARSRKTWSSDSPTRRSFSARWRYVIARSASRR